LAVEYTERTVGSGTSLDALSTTITLYIRIGILIPDGTKKITGDVSGVPIGEIID